MKAITKVSLLALLLLAAWQLTCAWRAWQPRLQRAAQ